jgi:hypothetical protein
MNDPIDITPSDSVSPIYLVELTQEELERQEQDKILAEDLRTAERGRNKNIESALSKLKKLGLSEEEARAIAGV